MVIPALSYYRKGLPGIRSGQPFSLKYRLDYLAGGNLFTNGRKIVLFFTVRLTGTLIVGSIGSLLLICKLPSILP